jgi:hypothetical protein
MTELVVYALADREVRYVGKTSKGLLGRVAAHLGDADRGARWPVHRWLRKRGGLVSAGVLSRHRTEAGANRAEIAAIARLRAEGAPLLNCTDGGDGVLGVVFSAEVRRERSERLAAGQASEMARLSHANRTDYSKSIETRAKISASLAGRTYEEMGRKPMQAETKLKIGLRTRAGRCVCRPNRACAACRAEVRVGGDSDS